MHRRPSRASLALILLGLCATASAAQEFRGAITGRVSDTSGSVIPGATVTVTNTATGVAATATTNEVGSYTVPYLTPATYTVNFELVGFRKVVRSVDVRVGDRVEVNVVLEPGAIAENVTVTAQTPLLDLTSGSSGQVVDEKRLAALPLADGNPFVLARFAPGIVYYGDLKFSRPFDNAGTSNIVADGAPGGNEFMIDGSPNEANKSGGLPRVAYVPPTDLVQQFKVETASFDAQQGHTAGAVINVVLKSGTNDFHGDGYGFLRNDTLSANDFFLKRLGQPKTGLEYKHWGGVIGGPVARNRTFFFAGFERLTDLFPEPGQYTVPTAAERQGDFSTLLQAGIVIYDPLTAQRQGNTTVRLPFPNNNINQAYNPVTGQWSPANRLSPIALTYLKYYPMPNQPGDAQGRNNYLSPNPRTDTFYAPSYRVDHELTSSQKLFVRYYRNHRIENRNNWTGDINGIKPTGNFLFRINDGVTAGHTYTINNSTLLDMRGGWSRFQELNQREHEGAIDPASLGFSSSTASLFGGASYLPRFDIGGMSSLGDTVGDGTIHSIYSFQPTVTKLKGSHSIRLGYDFRLYKEYGYKPGNVAGTYTFRTDYTRQTNLSASAPIGQDLAAFMLGQPTGGSIDLNANRLNYTPYHGLFVQDDWRATSRLTLNLGLRYELEGATTEAQNRNLRGFDATDPSPIQAKAQAAYALNPIPELSVANFQVLGGLTYADSTNRSFWNPDKTVFEPRAGFAYSVNDVTVVRGGFGVYAVPFIIDALNQTGYSQSTNLVPTLDNGLTFVANLANPFPNGATSPTGSNLGLATFLGKNVAVVPVDRKQARSARWSIGIERQLPGAWVVEAAYIGSHGYNLTTYIDADPIPAQFLSTSPFRDDATIARLDGNVSNPFMGLVPGTNLNGSVVSRSQLLRPFPQFVASGNQPGVMSQAYDGTNRFHSVQGRIEHRFSGGYTLTANYTWSRFRERVSKLNPTDTQYEDRVSENDVPHRLALSGIWELPFGRGHRFGGSSAWSNALTGGWSVQALGQIQSGRPLCRSESIAGQVPVFGYGPGSTSDPCALRNVYYNGDPNQLRANISEANTDNSFDTSGFYFHDPTVQTNGADDPNRQRADTRIRLADNLRTFPSRLDNFRNPVLNLWDISFVKRFALTEGVRVQLNFELLNAFNKVVFTTPNLDPTNSDFGRAIQQSNLPRNIQLAAKLLF
jgi:hypothetical protein